MATCSFDKNDLKIYLSGGISNTDPNASIGGAISFKPLSNKLFNAVAIPLIGTTNDYRCVYLKNESDKDITSLDVFIFSEIPLGSNVELGFGGLVNNVAFELLNEESTPPGVDFSSPSVSDSLNVTLDSGDYISLWIKRSTSSVSQAVQDDGLDIGLYGYWNCNCLTGCTGGAFSKAFSSAFETCT